MDIGEFPLIAITEILDMVAGDGPSYGMRNATVEDMLQYKGNELRTYDEYMDWNVPDWKQKNPVYLEDAGYSPDGTKLYTLRNGHHRVTKGHEIGLLFMHYTTDPVRGWKQ